MDLVEKSFDHFQCSKTFSAPSTPSKFIITDQWSCQKIAFPGTPLPKRKPDFPRPPGGPRPPRAVRDLQHQLSEQQQRQNAIRIEGSGARRRALCDSDGAVPGGGGHTGHGTGAGVTGRRTRTRPPKPCTAMPRTASVERRGAGGGGGPPPCQQPTGLNVFGAKGAGKLFASPKVLLG